MRDWVRRSYAGESMTERRDGAREHAPSDGVRKVRRPTHHRPEVPASISALRDLTLSNDERVALAKLLRRRLTNEPRL
jgi:hypothetical protein